MKLPDFSQHPAMLDLHRKMGIRMLNDSAARLAFREEYYKLLTQAHEVADEASIIAHKLAALHEERPQLANEVCDDFHDEQT